MTPATPDVFFSFQHNFSIALPKYPTFSRDFLSESLRANYHGPDYKWMAAEGTFAIVHYVLQGPQVSGPANLFELTRSVKNALMTGFKAQILSSADIRSGSHAGIEIVFTQTDGKKGINRVFVTGNEQYSLVVVMNKADAETEKLVIRALDSFKIITPGEKAAEIARRVKELTPPGLPQKPTGSRPSSDALDENLKGKVKTLTTEYGITSGEKTGRKASTQIFYDKNGNRMKEIVFDNGDDGVAYVEVYGYLDGKRVTKRKWTPPQPPPMGADINPALLPSITTQSKSSWEMPVDPKADQRYDLGFSYIYDAQKRWIETKWFNNKGEFIVRETRKYAGNKIERETTDEIRSRPTSAETITLDDKGRVIESHSTIFIVETAQIITTYTYQAFDQQGNWTSRTSAKVIRQLGENDKNEIVLEKRAFTYY